jgi:hypothetical protein
MCVCVCACEGWCLSATMSVLGRSWLLRCMGVLVGWRVVRGRGVSVAYIHLGGGSYMLCVLGVNVGIGCIIKYRNASCN